MAEIKDLVKQLGADEEQVYKAHKALLEMVTRATAPGKESDRESLAKALAEELTARQSAPSEAKGRKRNQPSTEGSLHPPQVRVRIIQLLGFVAGEKQIADLAETIHDLDLREMSRMALDFNDTSDPATQVLVKAVDDVGPEFRMGVVGALGRRGGAASLEALQKLAAEDSDPHVQIVAVEELAHFPDVKNDAIILEAAKGPYKSLVVGARIRLAESLRLAGLRPEARRIYNSIESSDAEAYQKKAAKIGLEAIG